jgi:hypothetical protein
MHSFLMILKLRLSISSRLQSRAADDRLVRGHLPGSTQDLIMAHERAHLGYLFDPLVPEVATVDFRTDSLRGPFVKEEGAATSESTLPLPIDFLRCHSMRKSIECRRLTPPFRGPEGSGRPWPIRSS